MAHIFQHYGSKGFYKTPISKCILGSMFMSTCALNVPVFSYLKQYISCSTYEVLYKREFWRLATRNLAFLDITDLLCCSLLIYYLRVFEKRFGSLKFASFIFGKLFFATLLEILAVVFINRFFDVHVKYLPSGPFGLIFPLFVDFYCDIPRVAFSHVFGIPITGKSFVYLIGLQVISNTDVSFLTALCCMVAGLLHRWNFLKVQNIVKIPNFIGNAADRLFGSILSSSPPANVNKPMGATLELQRQEIMDAMEQASIDQQMRLFQDRRQQQERELPNNETNVEQPPNVGLSWLRNRSNHVSIPDEMVNTLIEMGFDRQNALNALRSANNDLAAATAILLNES